MVWRVWPEVVIMFFTYFSCQLPRNTKLCVVSNCLSTYRPTKGITLIMFFPSIYVGTIHIPTFLWALIRKVFCTFSFITNAMYIWMFYTHTLADTHEPTSYFDAKPNPGTDIIFHTDAYPDPSPHQMMQI